MSGKRIAILIFSLIAAAAIVAGVFFVYRYLAAADADQIHYERDETELVVVNLTNARLALFRAGGNLSDAAPVPEFGGERIWLTKGNYFLRADQNGRTVFYPVPIRGYRSGTEKDDTFAITIRPLPDEYPAALPSASRFVFIPSGHFLFGDRLNPREPHLVWTQAFFIAQLEVSNAEFRQFLDAADGYADDANWTPQGKDWKARFQSRASARLTPSEAEFRRFGQDDQPVTQVTWFEAAAFCRWLTRKFGDGRLLFSLPTEAEWEKAARGPDNFDYPLGQTLSDAESGLYNWKKNPSADVTVIGAAETRRKFQPNRYGVYHLGGNVVEWTQGLRRAFNQEKPYETDDRNREDSPEVRVVRGGSWYSASNALLYVPYRDHFLPEISHDDLGFRIVARSLMF